MKSAKLRIQSRIIATCLLTNLFTFNVQAHGVEITSQTAPASIEYTNAIANSNFNSYYTYLQYKINSQYGITPDLTTDELKAKLSDDNFKQDLAHISFISMYGADTLNSFASSDNQKNFLTWLFQNVDVLNAFLEGGDPRNNKSLKALSIFEEIWITYPESHNGIYLTLAMATALEHADAIDTGWYQVNSTGKGTVIDPISRYNNYKNAHKAGKLYSVFDTLDVRHMRLVVGAWLTDADLDWARSTYSGPHSIVNEKGVTRNFTKEYNRSNIASAGHELEYNTYNASGTSVQNGALAYYGANATLETVLKVGGVCGAIAKYGASVAQAYGVPAMPIAQPGHAAAIYNKEDGIWALHNDISGFGESFTHGGTIIPWNATTGAQYVNGDGKTSTASFGPAYMLLFEDASKNPSNLYQSECLRVLANEMNTGDVAKAIRYKAMEICPQNIQTWRDQISALKQDSNTLASEWSALNNNIISTFANNPRPMTELLISIEDKVLVGASEEDKSSYVNSVFNTYETVTSPQQVQIRDIVERSMSSWMFNYIPKPTINFSFSGDNADKLMGFKKGMSFSIDGGKTFLFPTDNDYKLSISELNALTAENKIWVRNKYITDSTEDKMTIIDIAENTSDDINISGDDITNTVNGIDSTMEFSLDNGITWNKYTGTNLPNLNGNIAIKIRKFRTENLLGGSITELIFTDGTSDNPMVKKQSNVTYLSDIAWASSSNGWGPVELDTSNNERSKGDGRNININGVTYTKGLGCHADSTITYNLDRNYSRFITDIGADNETSGSVQFEVIADGNSIYKSDVLNRTSNAKHLDLNVTGVTTLTLKVTNGGNGNGADHADWAGAYLVSADKTAPTFDATTGTELDETNKIVKLTFSEDVVNALTNLDDLKAAITFAKDGTNYNALGENDTVEITDGKVVVTFNKSLTGNTNKIKLAANALKDISGNLKSDITETNAINGIIEIITPPEESVTTPAAVKIKKNDDNTLLTAVMQDKDGRDYTQSSGVIYEWYRNENLIPEKTTENYGLANDDKGNSIKVIVTVGEKKLTDTITIPKDETVPVENPSIDTTIPSVRIVGTERVGKTLSAEFMNITNMATTSSSVSYKWYRLESNDSENGDLVGEHKSYELTSSDQGKYIKLVAIYNGKRLYYTTSKIERKLSSGSSSSSGGSSSCSSSKSNQSSNNDSTSSTLPNNNQTDNNSANSNLVQQTLVWKKNSDYSWQLLENGQPVTGWKQVNGLWYLMDTTGTMENGWKQINDKWYLLKNDGTMATGWQQNNNKWYYLHSSGEMATGWQKINNSWYLLKNDGSMAIGWQKTNGKWYYLHNDGSMATNTIIDGYKIDVNGEWL